MEEMDKRDYTPNQHNIHVRQIWHLMDRSNSLKEYNEEDFRLHFRLRKDLVIDKGRLATYTEAASSYCFEILYKKNLRAGYWQFIWCFCICCMHSHSQGFKNYREKKRTFRFIPWELGWFKEMVNDVAYFSVVTRAIECIYLRTICPNTKENAMGRPHANMIFCVCTCQCNANWQSITVIYII